MRSSTVMRTRMRSAAATAMVSVIVDRAERRALNGFIVRLASSFTHVARQMSPTFDFEAAAFNVCDRDRPGVVHGRRARRPRMLDVVGSPTRRRTDDHVAVMLSSSTDAAGSAGPVGNGTSDRSPASTGDVFGPGGALRCDVTVRTGTGTGTSSVTNSNRLRSVRRARCAREDRIDQAGRHP